MSLGPAPKELRGCATAGCARDLFARGLCNTCYNAAWRKGALPITPKRPVKVAVKIWVSPEMDALLRRESRKSGQTVCELVRLALDSFWKRELEQVAAAAAPPPP